MKRSILLLLATAFCAAAAQNFVFPQPAGPFQVIMSSEEMVDTSRPDPFNSSHPRRLMLSRFIPQPRQLCRRTCRVDYMPRFIADLEDAILFEFLGDIGWPAGVLSQLKLELCCDESPTYPPNARYGFQTVLLDSGINTTRHFYSATAQHLASLGYLVLTIDHPYETDVVVFPDGTTIYGGRLNRTSSTADLVYGLEARAADARFLLDRLGLSHVAYVGHSFGGAAAATAMVSDPRIVAGVNLDGALWGPVLDTGFGGPRQSFLLLGSDGHNSSAEPSWAQFRRAMASRHPEEWVRELGVRGSAHGSLSDFSLLGDVTGLRNSSALVEAVFGGMTGVRAMEILTRYLGDYFEMAFRGKGEGLLAGPSEEFPEVVFFPEIEV